MKKILVFCISLLVLLTAGCTGDKKAAFTPDSPEGVVQAYYSALEKGKPGEAYEYLKTPWEKSKDEFIKEKSGSGMPFKEFSVGKAEVTGNTATVKVTLTTGNSAMPEMTRTIALEKAGSWKIASFDQIGISPGTAAPSDNGPPDNSGGYDPSAVNPHGPGGQVPLNK